MRKNNLIIGLREKLENIDKYIKNSESLVILDNSLESIENCKDKLIKNNYRVKIINLSDLDHSEKFNVLELPYELYKNKHEDDAVNILETIANILYFNDSTGDSFWNDSAASLFVSITLSLFDCEKLENITFDKIQSIINLEDIKSYYDSLNHKGLAYKTGFPIFNAPKETQGGIISVANQGIGKFTRRINMLNIMSSSSFDFKSMLNEKSAIIIKTDDIKKSNGELSTIIIYELYYYFYEKDHNIYNFIINDIELIKLILEWENIWKNSSVYNIYFDIRMRNNNVLKAKFDNIEDSFDILDQNGI